MESLLISAFIVINSVFGVSLSNDENTRYDTLLDLNDTTSWNDTYSLSANQSYHAIFKDYMDEDFYTFSSTYLRSVAIEVTSSNQVAQVYIYSNLNSTPLSYSTPMTFNYDNFADKLVCMAPNSTIYIKVCASTTASYYDIIANDNPNFSGVSIKKHTNGHEPTRYFGYPKQNITEIKFYCDTSCSNYYTNYGSFTFEDAYIDAVHEWNKISNLNIHIINNLSAANVVLYVNPSSYFPLNQLGQNNASVTSSGGQYYFTCTQAHVDNDYTNYLGSTSYETYRNIVSNCIQQIGYSIGLNNSTKVKNYMYYPITNVTINPFNEIGDGDVSSYLYIYG